MVVSLREWMPTGKTVGPVDLLRIQEKNNELQALANKFQRPPNCCPNLASLSRAAGSADPLQFSLEGGTLSATTSTPSLLLSLYLRYVLLLLINRYAIRNDIYYVGSFKDSLQLLPEHQFSAFNSWAEI